MMSAYAVALLAPLLLATQSSSVILLEVTDSDGKPANTRFVVADITKTVIMEGQIRDGVGEIRDLDFGFFAIAIGGYRCGSVVLRNIHLIYGQPQTFKVILNRCVDEGVTDLRCRVYYRIKSTAGEKLGGVRVSSGDRVFFSDEYGRVEVSFAKSDDPLVRFQKEAYGTVEERASCGVQRIQERTIAMQPVNP